MHLFKAGPQESPLLEVDLTALTADDWKALADAAATVIRPFRQARPCAGSDAAVILARSLNRYASNMVSDPYVIVDGWARTGCAVVDEMRRLGLAPGTGPEQARGLVVFAIGAELPPSVQAIMYLNPDIAKTTLR